MADKSTILINKLYAGSFLNEGDNLGYEVINLIESDQNEHYLYITSNGKVRNPEDVSSVIFVTYVPQKIENKSKERYEVIAYATGLERASSRDISTATYGGRHLQEIHEGNIYHGAPVERRPADEEPLILATFKAAEVRVPPEGAHIFLSLEGEREEDKSKKTLCLSVALPANPEVSPDSKIIDLPRNVRIKRLISESMRKPLRKSDIGEDAFEDIKTFISKYCTENASERYSLTKAGNLESDDSRTPTFLELIGRVFDENAYSNLITYYLRYSPRIAESFIATCLRENFNEIQIMDIQRERAFNKVTYKGDERSGRIDIWIEAECDGKRWLFIIENKIHSGLNSGGDQLGLYEEAVKQSFKPDTDSSFRIALLVPNHHELVSDPDLKEWEKADTHVLTTYGELHSFFTSDVCSSLADDPHFNDFCRSLERQKKSEPEATYDIMIERLKRRISKLGDGGN